MVESEITKLKEITMEETKNQGARAYMNAVRSIMDQAAETQGEAFDRAAQAIVRSIKAGGILYLFGSGHSHMMAEEGHYRAGGLAPVVPILSTNLMLHEWSAGSSKYERTVGVAPTILARYQPAERDVLVIFSNSGVNAAPVEMALTAKQQGLTVIGVVSLEYASRAPLSSLGKRLSEIADIVIDNQLPAGDALVEIGNAGLRSGPGSTVLGAFLLNALLTEVVWRLAAEGITPPVFISSNMPGGAQHNQELIEQYKSRNPHL
jgi:uncharacterized phosphosugar-binding protein